MFTPHHIVNHNNRYGVIFNESEALWCVWSYTNGKIQVWNDPITQHTMLSDADLNYVSIWLMQKLVIEVYDLVLNT